MSFYAPWEQFPPDVEPTWEKTSAKKEKPVHAVAKRNARERRRVQAVNSAFARLRTVVPVHHVRGKRISKVKTLQHAIDYIHGLLELLHQPYFAPRLLQGDLFDGFAGEEAL